MLEKIDKQRLLLCVLVRDGGILESWWEVEQKFALEGKKNMDNWSKKWVFFSSQPYERQ